MNKAIHALLLFVFLNLLNSACGQSLSISGKINSSNAIAFSVTTAGENPLESKLFTNNKSQSLSYEWPFFGVQYEEQTYLYGSIYVSSSISIPSGLQWTIQCADPGSSYGQWGSTTNQQILTIVPATLISGIWSTNWLLFFGPTRSITNNMTQTLSLTNFADLHPTPGGDYQTIVIYYSLE